MATIEERVIDDGTTRYRVRVRLKGCPELTATFRRRTDARLWAQKTEAAIREGRHFGTVATAKRRTVADAIDRYLDAIMPRKKPSTAAVQIPQLHWWRDRLGGLALADVTPAAIGEALDQVGRGPTGNRYLAVLSHVFTVCSREWGWAADNPVRRVGRAKESRGRVRFLSDEERERLLAACQESSNLNLYDAVVLALCTGCRKGELLGLRWPAVSFDRGQITLLDTKNGEIRAVPLGAVALEVLRRRHQARAADDDRVFPGNAQAPGLIDRAFRKAVRQAGIEDFRFHDLRHSTASYLAMNGASLAEIAAVLGHKTLSMVKRYSHLSEQHTAAVVRAMNDRVFGRQEEKADDTEEE